MARAHCDGRSHSLERRLSYVKGIDMRHVLTDVWIELIRDEERKIISLSSGSLVSANSRCCLKTIKYIHAGDYHSFNSETRICRRPQGSGRMLFSGRVGQG